MEAALITKAKRIIGSDIEERQSASSLKNLEWLVEHQILTANDAERTEIFAADARQVHDRLDPASIHVVISEGMMGPPLRGHESRSIIEKNAKEISALWIQTLDRLRPALAKGARLVIIWPSFKTDGGIARVGLDEEVTRLGYRVVNPLGSWDESNGPLIYHRQGQRVARRIVVLAYVG
jgi:tRNA G10  N-methylase Trm11